ncbi:MAG: TolC family outer membrane protein, partial [Hyphomicrobiales bacterium]|nr:TolC family outer membrane protein [Hyphomicrobiales bacterium]
MSGSFNKRLVGAIAAGALAAALAAAPSADAETLSGALLRAYRNNPDINQQRAAVRAADEGVPKASAGYRPTIAGVGSVGVQNEEAGVQGVGSTNTSSVPRSFGVTATETLFNGGRTGNSVRAAESGVFGARETLRNTVQNTLLNAVTFYMNVLRDTAILDLDKKNVAVLAEQLRQTKDRFAVGEVTNTDVAQAQASLAGAQAVVFGAQANLANSVAGFRQYVGEQPTRLAPVKPLGAALPKSLAAAIALSQAEHPAIVAARHGVDAAALAVKVAEGALYPTVQVAGSVQQAWDQQNKPGTSATIGSIVGSISVPLWDGGATYAGARQAKEQLGQQEMAVDSVRAQVRAAVVSSWGQFEASAAAIRSDRAQVDAASRALAGVREEAKVGQRTTLDVLNAHQTLLNARVQLVGAERDRVVASYAVLASVGRLSLGTLG